MSASENQTFVVNVLSHATHACPGCGGSTT